MPFFSPPASNFKARKSTEAEWKELRQGLNLFSRETELGRDAYVQADNIMLVGSGAPTGRWGTSTYFLAGATGSIRGFGSYEWGLTTSKDLLTLTDQGFLQKKNGASSTMISGISYPSGSEVRMDQLGGKTYIVSKDRALVSYDGLSLVLFATISPPTNLLATNMSNGFTGTTSWSWKVVQLGANGGQTTPSTNVVLQNMPQDLTTTTTRVSWTASAGISYTGFEIYRGLQGDETFLANVGPSVSQYIDTGEEASPLILAPITNTTGGIQSRFIKRVGDRFVFVDANDPSKLVITGRYPNHAKISWADGGGFIYIDPDNGRAITGVDVQPGSNKIVVYKDYASYAVELTTIAIGNYQILDAIYQPISTTVGACNQDVITGVENDIFYFGRKGLYVTGYEPNFLNIIRTNEISARIRPYLANLGDQDYKNACAFYVDNKYILSFPDRKECIVYDRERGAFVGIWQTPYGISKMFKYVDSSGSERWVIGSANSNQTYTFEPSVNSDNGTTITKTLRLNKEDFGDWSAIKTIDFFHVLFRNITGQVNINILLEDRDGSISNVKTFTITGTSVSGSTGWGAGGWGKYLWSKWGGDPVGGSDEFVRWGTLFKQGRLLQIEIVCSAANSNFEFLSAKIGAKLLGRGTLSSSQRV